MASNDDLNSIPYYPDLSFQKPESANEQADMLRKRLVQTYTAATNLLDNDDTIHLLNSDLKKYSNFIFNNEGSLCADISKNAQSKDCEWHSSLDKVDLKSILNPFPCSNDIFCEKTKYINEGDLHEFAQIYNSTSESNPDINAEQKPRKIAKSFAPRTCNTSVFKTAREELDLQNLQKFGHSSVPQSNQLDMQQPTRQKRQLGIRRNVHNKFISPMLSHNSSEDSSLSKSQSPVDEVIDERLKNIDPKMVELIRSEIMDCGTDIDWTDIVGLEFAKTAIQEAAIWPLLRPDIFKGLRRPPKGVLLFGPPGTGKTLIGKCVASQSKSTFFSISASSLTSKWIGDGEKMVRALFAVARCHQPAVIFIDEIDSLLSQRSDTEHESSRRIKTEFLVQLDGATTDNEERLLLIGATNRPQELDEAVRRRFVKRLYIPLPDLQARLQLISRLMTQEKHSLTEEDIQEISRRCEGYSGADVKSLCSEASLGPVRCIDISMIQSIEAAEVRPVNREDFMKALDRVKSSVSPNDLNQYVLWNNTYGSGSGF